VRVIHQNVNYDQTASVGSKLTISVFDALARVADVTGTIEILRAGTKGKSLHVTDMYEIQNASSPPVTQAGTRTFDVYLPANAKLDSVLAAGPEKIGVMISATPVSGEPGHYTVSFPLRPGATKFAFNYDLPYDGHAAFQTRHVYPLQQLAVMIPATMKFSSPSSKFMALATGNGNYQVRAANQLIAGQGPTFTISGNGDLLPLRYQTKTQAPSQPSFVSNSTVSGAGRVVPLSSGQTNSHFRTLSRGSTVLWVGASCLLWVCIIVAWRTLKVRADITRRPSVQLGTSREQSKGLLESVKDNLFQLESDRMRGLVSEEEYASARQTLQETVERAIARMSKP